MACMSSAKIISSFPTAPFVSCIKKDTSLGLLQISDASASTPHSVSQRISGICLLIRNDVKPKDQMH